MATRRLLLLEHQKELLLGSDRWPGLDETQQQAVCAGSGPTLVFAGPGSGKTLVLTRRVAFLHMAGLIEPPFNALAITFTNKAAAELRTRLGAILGNDLPGVWAGTFHAFGLRILQGYYVLLGYGESFTLLDEEARRSFASVVVSRTERVAGRRIDPPIAAISRLKNEMVTPDLLRSREGETDLVAIYDQYQTDLRHFGYVDYDDLLLLPLDLLHRREDVLRIYRDAYPHILIDEYQDTNMVQLEFLKLLCPPPGNLFAVADDDQQIYGFRGASERSVRELQETYRPMVIHLGINYRSTENIISRASNLMRGAAGRQPKPTQKSILGKGPDVRVVELDDSDDEAGWIAQEIAEALSCTEVLPGQVAVVSPRRADLMPIREALEALGVEALVIGAEDLRTSSLIQKVVGFLRVVDNPLDPLAVASVVEMALSDRPEGLAALLDACGRMPTAEWILGIPDGSVPALSAGDLSEIKGLFSYLLAMRDSYRASNDVVREVSRLPYIAEEGRRDPSAALDLRKLQAFARETVAGGADASLKRLIGDLAISDVDQRVQELQGVVQLHTCHGVKGLEFDTVYVLGVEDGNIPFYYSRTPRQVESDRKALYVALTRAKRQLTVTWANRRRAESGQMYQRKPSPFLSDI